MGGILGRRAWERSNGGLWLPAVYWFPVEMGFCCCSTGSGCGIWVDNVRPSTVTLVVDGLIDGTCPCSDFNTTYELNYNEDKSTQEPNEEFPNYLCVDWYDYTPGDEPTGHVMATAIFIRETDVIWSAQAEAWTRCPGNQFNPYFYVFASWDPQRITYSSAFETDQVYSNNGSFSGQPGQCPPVLTPGITIDVYT